MVQYQDETPFEVADRAWARESPHLRPWEVFRIAAWKTGQGLGWLSLAEEDFIVSRTEEAMVHLREWRQVDMVNRNENEVWTKWREASRSAIGNHRDGSGLLGITGVGYPMATAILCILDPRTWPVMDRWAVETVFGIPDARSNLPKDWWQRASSYEAYARHLAIKGAECWGNGLTLHELDVKAMRVSQKRVGALVDVPENWTFAEIPSADW